jgi:hypothetical protein
VDVPKAGQPVAPDIEAWFQTDQFAGSPSIVAQWADAHNSIAQAWVLPSGSTYEPKNPTPQQQYVLDWAKAHPAVIAKFKNDNPTITDPQPADLAVVFFETFSRENSGQIPVIGDAAHPDNGALRRRRTIRADDRAGPSHDGGEHRLGYPIQLFRHVASG